MYKKSLLIITSYTKNAQYLNEFTKHIQLLNPELCIELFNPFSLQLYSYKEYQFVNEKSILLFKWLRIFLQVKIIRSIFSHLYGCLFFSFSSRKYSTVCFHVASPYNAALINALNKISDFTISVVWGSDFYRANKYLNYLSKYFFRRVNRVLVGTHESAKLVLDRYPFLNNRIDAINFGNEKLTKSITDFTKHKTDNKERKLVNKESLDDIVITIGYNNKAEHQHLKVIEEINELPSTIKSNLTLLVPLTYPSNNLYKKSIIDSLERYNFDYVVVDEFLNNEELIQLRLISDIFINMQTTDMFSASVMEYMAMENVVLNAKWLPYSYIDKSKIYAHKVNWSNLKDKLIYVIRNLDEEKARTISNKSKIIKLIDWNELAPLWSEYLKLD